MGYWKNGVYYFGKNYSKDNPSPAEQAWPDHMFGNVKEDGLVGSLLNGFGESIFGEGFGDLNLGQSLKSWLDSMSGADLTNAQKAMNDYNSSEAEKQRDFASSEAAIQRDFASKEAELAYDRQTQFYDKYQSIGAQIRQYKENGLNPALLAGGVSVGSTPSSPAASSSVPSSSAAASSSPSSNPMALVSFIMQLAGIKSQIDKTKAETANIKKETSWIDDINTTNVDNLRSMILERQSNIEKNSAEVDQISQSIAESIKRCSVMDSQIRVNDSVVDVNLSQSQLNEVKSHVENLNSQSIQKMLPYIEARQEAEIALTNAKTTESKFMAEQLMYEANLKMLKGLVEADLISKGYYDSVIEQAGWDVRQAKRNYKWTPVNNLCTCFRDVCIGASSIAGAGVKVAGAL